MAADFFLYVLRDDKVAEELWTRFETSGRATLAQGADGSADAALALPLPPSSASVHVAVPGGGEALTARKAGLEDGGSGLLTKIGSGPREGMVDVAALARPEAPWWEQVRCTARVVAPAPPPALFAHRRSRAGGRAAAPARDACFGCGHRDNSPCRRPCPGRCV